MGPQAGDAARGGEAAVRRQGVEHGRREPVARVRGSRPDDERAAFVEPAQHAPLRRRRLTDEHQQPPAR